MRLALGKIKWVAIHKGFTVVCGIHRHRVVTWCHYYVRSIFSGLLFPLCCLSLDTTQVLWLLSFCLLTFHPFLETSIQHWKRKKKKSPVFNKSNSSCREEFLSCLEQLFSLSSFVVFYVFLWAEDSFWNCKELWSSGLASEWFLLHPICMLKVIFPETQSHHLGKIVTSPMSVKDFLQQEWKTSLKDASDKKLKMIRFYL